MKVLLCTPYLQDPKIITGGINIWEQNVRSYYEQILSDITLDVVSFDRKYNVKEDNAFIQRIVWGLKEYLSSIKQALWKLENEGPFHVLHLCTSAQLGHFKDYMEI